MNSSLILSINIDEQEFAWITGKRFDGLTISRKPRGWAGHVKATTKAGAPVYIYFFCGDLPSLVDTLSTFYGSKASDKEWYADKYRR